GCLPRHSVYTAGPPRGCRTFCRLSSKWHRHLRAQRAGDARLWEIAVLFHLRDAFRSGDVWLTRSRRYGDLKHALVPAQAIA
ncbi:hypothetical protein J8J20_24495, partial [Mycobacterium tuberculosis]|nr:hypothetical protein [Mycobacterium tuberculosis]